MYGISARLERRKIVEKLIMESNKYNYRVYWWPEDESYVAQCKKLPSIYRIGATAEKALKKARRAASGINYFSYIHHWR
jgi:hypothetical protein